MFAGTARVSAATTSASRLAVSFTARIRGMLPDSRLAVPSPVAHDHVAGQMKTEE
jgi:hypothetical protein